MAAKGIKRKVATAAELADVVDQAKGNQGAAESDPSIQALAVQVAASEQKIDHLASTMLDLTSKLGQLIDNRQAPAVVDRSRVDSRELEGAEMSGLVTGKEDSAELVHITPDVDPENPFTKSRLEYERFMAEKVTIKILSSGGANEDPVVELSVNGRAVLFVRDVEKTVPRRYLEQLARLKKTNYANEEFVRADGARDVHWPSRTGNRYAFQVLHDPNPKGREWLDRIQKSSY
jgi:hypothetical protein